MPAVDFVVYASAMQPRAIRQRMFAARLRLITRRSSPAIREASRHVRHARRGVRLSGGRCAMRYSGCVEVMLQQSCAAHARARRLLFMQERRPNCAAQFIEVAAIVAQMRRA